MNIWPTTLYILVTTFLARNFTADMAYYLFCFRELSKIQFRYIKWWPSIDSNIRYLQRIFHFPEGSSYRMLTVLILFLFHYLLRILSYSLQKFFIPLCNTSYSWAYTPVTTFCFPQVSMLDVNYECSRREHRPSLTNTNCRWSSYTYKYCTFNIM